MYCLVTGATSGIGRAAARKLAARSATVLMTGRNRERGERALREIKQTTGNDRVELFLADFAVRDEVCALAERLWRMSAEIVDSGPWIVDCKNPPLYTINYLRERDC